MEMRVDQLSPERAHKTKSTRRKIEYSPEDDRVLRIPERKLTEEEVRALDSHLGSEDDFAPEAREVTDGAQHLVSATERPIIAERADRTFEDRTFDFSNVDDEEDTAEIGDALPLQRFLETHPHLSFSLSEVGAGDPSLERAKLTAEYEEFRRAVAAYVPDRGDLQLPEVGTVVRMSEQEIAAFVGVMERVQFMRQIQVPFMIYAEKIRALSAVEYRTDNAEWAAK